MWSLSIIAIRNVVRNKRRSFFAGLAMIIGTAFIVFLNGFFNGFMASIVDATVEGSVGALQVHKKGFIGATSDPLKHDMPADDAFIATMASVEGVKHVTPRINFEGMLNNGVSANIVAGLAIDPEREYQVCPRRREIEPDGSLQPDHADQIILGSELATSMELTPGSSVSVLSATQQGAQNALDATMRGRLDSPVPLVSKRLLIVPLAFAQNLLKMSGRATEYAISLDNLAQLPTVKRRLEKLLGPDYEVLAWDERDTNAAAFVGRIKAIFAVVVSVLFVLVLTFIVNSMLAAVYERVREIGTMLAVGVRRTQVLRMFLVESMMLGLGASLLGSALGSAAVLHFHRQGILLQPPGAKATMLYPFLNAQALLIAVAVSVAGALVAALYPAFKASRLSPVEALRAN